MKKRLLIQHRKTKGGKIAKKKKVTAEDIESKDFYSLMQIYRFVPLSNQKWLIEAYTDVKTYIADFINRLITEKQE